jgi:hypothetical protein
VTDRQVLVGMAKTVLSTEVADVCGYQGRLFAGCVDSSLANICVYLRINRIEK